MTIEMSDPDKEKLYALIRQLEDEILPEVVSIRETLESDEEFWAEDESWEGTTDQAAAQNLIEFMLGAETYLTDGVRALTDAYDA